VGTAYDGERLSVTVRDADGAPVEGLRIEAVVGRPAGNITDRTLMLSPDATGGGAGHTAPIALDHGSWRVALRIEGGETPWQAVAPLWVPRPREDAG
ncbi:MAG: FixH family protein, partial [Pseudomonadota bacterium]